MPQGSKWHALHGAEREELSVPSRSLGLSAHAPAFLPGRGHIFGREPYAPYCDCRRHAVRKREPRDGISVKLHFPRTELHPYRSGTGSAEGPEGSAAESGPAEKEETKKADTKKQETMTQKVKRTWRGWTTRSHAFCVRCPIPIPFTAKVCTAKGKTVDEARNVCIQQNPLCYVSAGRC
jgi:hypothetical protein